MESRAMNFLELMSIIVKTVSGVPCFAKMHFTVFYYFLPGHTRKQSDLGKSGIVIGYKQNSSSLHSETDPWRLSPMVDGEILTASKGQFFMSVLEYTENIA